MKGLYKFILTTLMVALIIIGLEGANFRTCAGVSDPSITLKQNGQTVTSLNVAVCTEFTVDIWIEGIPDGWGVVGFGLLVEWDPEYMDYEDLEIDDHGWGDDVQVFFSARAKKCAC